jgi:hypothetical protein
MRENMIFATGYNNYLGIFMPQVCMGKENDNDDDDNEENNDSNSDYYFSNFLLW